MSKLLSIITAVFVGYICISSVWAASKASCSITCYEKTPDCYVSKDKEGCLIIGNEKPKKNKEGRLICIIPGCETATKY